MTIHRILQRQMKALILAPGSGKSDICKAYDDNPVDSPVSSENEENIKTKDGDNDNDNDRDRDFDFSFAFSYKHLHETPVYVSADKLFHNGKIKPLKVHEDSVPLLSKVKKENSSKTTSHQKHAKTTTPCSRVFNLSPKHSVVIRQCSREKTATSLSLRSSGSCSGSSLSLTSWYTKWKLKDLSLFRSASEGHATRDNYVIVRKTHETSGSGSTDRSSTSSGRKSCGEWRRKEGISPHERHYRKNRAAAEEMRRKTFLPYKKTLMGCSDLDPGVHEFCKGHAVEIKYC